MTAFIFSQFNCCPLVWMYRNKILNNRTTNFHERTLRGVYSDKQSTFKELLEIDSSTTLQFVALWHCGVVVITTAQLHLTKLELRFCADSKPACGVSEIHDGEDL